MYSEEQRVKALRMYHRIGSVTDTVRRLGYPSREQLHNWIRNEGKPRGKRKKPNCKNTIEHPRNPPAEFKLEVFRRCFEKGDSVKLVSEEIGYSRSRSARSRTDHYIMLTRALFLISPSASTILSTTVKNWLTSSTSFLDRRKNRSYIQKENI